MLPPSYLNRIPTRNHASDWKLNMVTRVLSRILEIIGFYQSSSRYVVQRGDEVILAVPYLFLIPES